MAPPSSDLGFTGGTPAGPAGAWDQPGSIAVTGADPLASGSPSQAIERTTEPWHAGIAPRLITGFLWVAWFDQLAVVGRLDQIGLFSALGGLALGAMLCQFLWIRGPSTWGLKTGRGVFDLARSTFGMRGVVVVPGIVLGCVQIVWLAFATCYALEWTLLGLIEIGWLSPTAMRPPGLGDRGRSLTYLVSAIVWLLAFALIGVRALFVRMIAALNQVFPIFAAIAMAVALLWVLTSSPTPSANELTGVPANPPTPWPAPDASRWEIVGGIGSLVQIVLVYGAMMGLAAAEWGRTCRNHRDVNWGGWIGGTAAALVIGSLALVTVFMAGLDGETKQRLTYRAVLTDRIGGTVGAGLLLVFALESMAPAIYAVHMLSRSFQPTAMSWKRLIWAAVGATIALPLVLTGWLTWVELWFGLIGSVVGALIGAMTADWARAAGVWPGPRSGWNRAGLFAWGIGGLLSAIQVLLIEASPDLSVLRVAPPVLLAFCVSFTMYQALSRLGLEPPLNFVATANPPGS